MSSSACNGEAESNMKIYLLVTLVSALLIAIRFTTAREQQDVGKETFPPPPRGPHAISMGPL